MESQKPLHSIYKFEDEIEEYTFFYKIEGVSIKREIDIGNSRIVNISKEETKLLLSISHKKSVEDYYNELEGVHLKITIKEVYKKAKIIALREAELSIDVLKCFLTGYTPHICYAIPDLMHRAINHKVQSYYAFSSNSKTASTIYQSFSGSMPMPLDVYFWKEARQRGFEYFSNFIKHKHNDELYLEIIEILHRFGHMASLSIHEKIVYAISLLEGAILDRSYKGRSFGEKRIKNNVLPKITTKQLDLFQTAIRRAYEIRNMYIHNCVELPVEEKTIWIVAEIIRVFIIRLIELHNNGKTEFEDISRYFMT